MVTLIEDTKNKFVFAHIGGGDQRVRIGMRVGLFQVGKLDVKVARHGIKTGPKTGRMYKHKGRNKRASGPGQYPANRSGELRRSVDFKVLGFKRMFFGARKLYGKFLEEGTKSGGKFRIIPRPFLTKTVKKNRQMTKNILYKTLNEELIRG